MPLNRKTKKISGLVRDLNPGTRTQSENRTPRTTSLLNMKWTINPL